MRRSRGGAAFYVETLLLVLFLLASLTVLEGVDGRSLSVFAELTADGGYRVIQWRQSAEWAGEAEAPALFGTLREG